MKNESIEVIFCGDACFKEQHEVDEEKAKGILEDVAPELEKADLRVVNLECPIAPAELDKPIRKAGPNITGRPSNVGFLKAGGFELAVMANNHTLDFGVDAFNFTRQLLTENGISYVGAGDDLDDAYKAFRTVIKAVKLSIIAVCEHEFGLAGLDSPGTAAYSDYRLAEAIRAEREISDFVIVVFHGGCEHNPLPTPVCRDRYRTITMLGADAVIAMHTHCPQGYELCNGKPIFYSLGNFLFKYSTVQRPSWYVGYMVRLKLGEKLDFELIPYRFETDGSRINLLCGAEKQNMLDYIDRLSSIITDDRELARYFDGWCSLMSGATWANGEVKSEYSDITKQPERFPNYCDVFTCEAHHEMISNHLRMFLDPERLALGALYASKIDALKLAWQI